MLKLKTAWNRHAFKVALALSIGLFIAQFAATAHSADLTWNRGGNNSWKNVNNWLPAGSYPHLAADTATFNLNTATAAATPALNETVTINKLTVNQAPSSTNFGLTINPGSSTTFELDFGTASGNAAYVENANPTPGTGTTVLNSIVRLNASLDAAVQGQLTFANTLTGAGGLNISGPGRVTLTSDNSYGDGIGTTVGVGSTLVATNATGSATGTGPVVVHGTLSGTGLIGGPVTLGGGTIAPGLASGAPSTLTLASLTAADSSVHSAFLLGSVSDHVNVTGNLTLAGSLAVTGVDGFGPGLYSLFSYGGILTDNGFSIGSGPSGFHYALDFSQAGVVGLSVVAVPEPSTCLLASAGLVTLGFSARRKRRRS